MTGSEFAAPPPLEGEPPGDTVLLSVQGPVALLTLNRPGRRNAISTGLIATLPVVASEVARRDDIRVLVVTGSDPAFCAGLDLHELGTTGANLGLPVDPAYAWPWETRGKPVIGAVNGPAVAGGFELALHCDILVASERARFADTHARVGQVPGAGLTVRLPRLIGPGRAREMSLTGNFIDAETALLWGLVTHVVPHDGLIPFAIGLAEAIASNDSDAVVAINDLYRRCDGLPLDQGLALEAEAAREWQASHNDPAVVGARTPGILARAHRELERLQPDPGT